MEVSRSSLTVFFEEPFWVGVYERESGGRCAVCKITFGAEPKDYEVYAFLEKNWNSLRFSPPVKVGPAAHKPGNPKRMQCAIKRELQSAGTGTKAQQALKLQQEEGKIARKTRTRACREAEEARRFALRREKQKEKHKGH